MGEIISQQYAFEKMRKYQFPSMSHNENIEKKTGLVRIGSRPHLKCIAEITDVTART